VKTSEKSTASTNVNANPNKVITAATLSNYVNNTLTFNYDENNFGNYHNRLVRASNVIHYFNINRHTDITDFSGDIAFVTPKATSNYIKRQFDNYRHSGTFTGNVKYTTPNTVIDYVNSRKYDSNESLIFNNDFNFTTPAAVKSFGNENYVHLNQLLTAFDNNNFNPINNNTFIPNAKIIGQYFSWAINESTLIEDKINAKIAAATFNMGELISDFKHNDIQFVTPAAVSNYVADLYIPLTKIVTSSTGYGGYLVDDDMIPTTAEASNIAKDILDQNIGNLGANSKMTELESEREDKRDMLVTEGGLFGILHNSYERRNLKNGNIYEYSLSGNDINDKYIPTCGLTSNMINERIFELVKNNRETPGEDIYIYSKIVDDKFENEYIPTIGFMNREIISTINSRLESGEIELNLDSLNIGSGLNTSNMTVQHLKVEQDITFLSGAREGVLAREEFMTLNDLGEVIFMKVNIISGSSNVVREDDHNSLITGLNNTTFGENQYVCGQFNATENIYKRIDYAVGKSNTVNMVVGTGSDDANKKNGLEVHNTGEVYVNNSLILGDTWRLSFNSDQLVIEKYNTTSKAYEQKHIFK